MNNDVSRIGTAANVPVGDVVRTCEHIPVLRSHLACPPSLDHAVYARTTCYPAGHLVAKNAGWRNIRPVIDAEKCTNCLQCYLCCPDGAIYRVPAACQPSSLTDVDQGDSPLQLAERAGVAVDYDFCKGCGICVRMCRFGALRMIPESEANE